MSKVITAANVIELPIVSGGSVITDKDSKTVSFQFGIDEPSKSIGLLLEQVKPGTEFRFLGATVKIPAGTFSAQFNRILSVMIDAAFTGCDVKDEPKTTEGKQFVSGLKGKLHFSTGNFEQVKEALKIRQQNYRKTVAVERLDVRTLPANQAIISDTETKTRIVKAAKEGGRPAVLALISEMKKEGTKVIGWDKQ